MGYLRMYTNYNVNTTQHIPEYIIFKYFRFKCKNILKQIGQKNF